MSRRGWLRASLAVLALIALLDVAAVARGGFPTKIVEGASVTAGSRPSPDWWFAAGRSEGGVTVDLHLLNPGDGDARVIVRYLVGGGIGLDRHITLGPAQALTLATSADRAGGFGGGYPGVSMEVRADGPIVAERTMAWNAPKEGRRGFTTGPGLNRLVTQATFPAGSTAPGDREWITVLNPGDTEGDVTLRWPSGSRVDHIRGRDRIEVELPPGLAVAPVQVAATMPVAVERTQQGARGIDVSGPASVGASPVVPVPFGSPVHVFTDGGCAGAPVDVAGVSATVVPGTCALVWTTESTEPGYGDIVSQPATVAGTEWDFAAWGGAGQTDQLLVFNPGPALARLDLLALPRRVFGNQPARPPPAPSPVDLRPGESRVLDFGTAPAALTVRSSSPIAAWRIERARRAFVRSYTDPGFR